MNNKPKSAISAAKSVMAGSLVIKVVSFLGSIVVARHLMPEDYGYWVLVMLIQSFFTTLLDTGIEQFYVVNVKLDFAETEEGRHYELDVVNNLLFFRIAVNIVLFLLQITLSFLPLHFLESPIGEIVRIMSLTHIFNCFGSVNKVRLQKMMDFGTITKVRFVSEFIGTSLRIIFAMSGFGVYTFALSGVSSAICNNLLIALKAKFHFNKELINKVMLKKILEFWNFSWVASTVSFTSSQLDKFFLTTFFTTTQVGYYNFGNTLATQIQSYIMTPLASVNSTYIANNKDSQDKLSKMIDTVLSTSICIVLPILICFVSYADIYIEVLYTPKWSDSIPYIRIFSILSFVNLLIYPYYGALVAIGKLRHNMIFSLIHIAALTLLIVPIGYFSKDPLFYACAYVFANALLGLYRVRVTNKYLKVKLWKIYHKLVLSIVISLIYTITLYYVRTLNLCNIYDIGIGIISLLFVVLVNLIIYRDFFKLQLVKFLNR